MPERTEVMWLDISDKFNSETNFPNCVDPVYGKLIRCINPRGVGYNYYNYMEYVSVLLMRVAYANLSFVAIDVGLEEK
ncbi:hypothetical protein PR048_016238 [Dryococelus australis]|uniref:Uncharacterized protein n=1 Tax=Dryococelus australis TaxID=614101 RepID=A0ABQ9HJ66_9NEOP|nr:hypothetical protein PR048_016238 [Dryococelus australis]